ncbi:hypothetical protein [Pseudogemmobacter faecipullorum]|uniref:Uncharacterized protein n=1 Tax=Pseudogemmobacter faecipullorum TaxID=2755041 RepID=A0ABS8CQP2_9RHOB|nr:hypothetical protein [Pseudogemmobacter faecipullorum]MCB5411714.1 hypothetical protein [Pseudogemmobacter faecipullorum]
MNKQAINHGHDEIQKLSRMGVRRLTQPTIETLLLDRLLFPRRGPDHKITGDGNFIIVVKTTVAPKGGEGAIKIKWLYVEWETGKDTILIASGNWEHHPGGTGKIDLSAVGVVNCNRDAIKFDTAARVTVASGNTVVKLKSLNEREFYSLISEFNGQGRDGFSVQTGKLPRAKAASVAQPA